MTREQKQYELLKQVDKIVNKKNERADLEYFKKKADKSVEKSK